MGLAGSRGQGHKVARVDTRNMNSIPCTDQVTGKVKVLQMGVQATNKQTYLKQNSLMYLEV